MPVLLLEGADDPRPVRFVQALAGAMRNSRLVRVARSGHYPWVEQPEAARTALRDFLLEGR